MSDEHEHELRVNELQRFRKTSTRLALEAYSHCEVPAGCGGVVLRWRKPDAPIGLSFFTYAAGTLAEWCLDGTPLAEQRVTVDPGEHVLSLRIEEPGDRGFLMLKASLNPEIVTASNPIVTSRGDGRWRAIATEPGAGWQQQDFDDAGFVALVERDVPKPRDNRKWSWERLRETATGLGLPPNVGSTQGKKSWLAALERKRVERVWVRWTFSVDHRGFA